MEYIKVNVYYFGNKHISSGVYVVTAQEDSVGVQGFKTTLQLVRVMGDTDIPQMSSSTSNSLTDYAGKVVIDNKITSATTKERNLENVGEAFANRTAITPPASRTTGGTATRGDSSQYLSGSKAKSGVTIKDSIALPGSPSAFSEAMRRE